MTRHTPGPWIVVETGIESSRPRCFSARIHCDRQEPAGLMEVHHNAKLIAAAPDMLEALETLRTKMHELKPFPIATALAIIEAAIFKARGES